VFVAGGVEEDVGVLLEWIGRDECTSRCGGPCGWMEFGVVFFQRAGRAEENVFTFGAVKVGASIKV